MRVRDGFPSQEQATWTFQQKQTKKLRRKCSLLRGTSITFFRISTVCLCPLSKVSDGRCRTKTRGVGGLCFTALEMLAYPLAYIIPPAAHWGGEEEEEEEEGGGGGGGGGRREEEEERAGTQVVKICPPPPPPPHLVAVFTS